MKTEILKYQKIDEVPQSWDEVAHSYFQKKVFLSYLEKYNPCLQRYYLCYQNCRLISCAVVYSINIDLLTFAGIKSPLTMHVVGIPCSISCPGIFGEYHGVEILKSEIHGRESGLSLFLNLEYPFKSSKYLSGPTLPTIVISNSFDSWKDYISALRAPYRRRINGIVNEIHGVAILTEKCSCFSEQMYQQYLQVFQKSKAKLEKLSLPFFRNLHDPFSLLICSSQDKVLGWAITIFDQDTHYFFVGGLDYKLNKKYKTYFRLLIAIVRQGISLGAKYIDLGQTAEIPKMRMAGKISHRFLEAGHSVGVFNRLLKVSEKLLVYRRNFPEAHVLKTAS